MVIYSFYMNAILKQMSFIIAGVAIFLALPLMLSASPQKEKDVGSETAAEVITPGELPFIDALESSGFQTATFALG
jgi:hypothetical protein